MFFFLLFAFKKRLNFEAGNGQYWVVWVNHMLGFVHRVGIAAIHGVVIFVSAKLMNHECDQRIIKLIKKILAYGRH